MPAEAAGAVLDARRWRSPGLATLAAEGSAAGRAGLPGQFWSARASQTAADWALVRPGWIFRAYSYDLLGGERRRERGMRKLGQR